MYRLAPTELMGNPVETNPSCMFVCEKNDGADCPVEEESTRPTAREIKRCNHCDS